MGLFGNIFSGQKKTLQATDDWPEDLSKLRSFPGLVTGLKGGGKELHFFDPSSGGAARAPLVFPAEVKAYAVAPVRKWLAIAMGDSGTIKLWDYAEGTEKGAIERPEPVTALAWDEGEETLFAGHKSTTLAALKVPSGEVTRTLSIPSETMAKIFEKPLENVTDLLLAPGGGTLAALMGAGVLATWDLRGDGSKINFHLAPPNRFFNIRFSPDGRYLAAAAGSYSMRIGFSSSGPVSVEMSNTRGMLWLLDIAAERSQSVSDTSYVMENVFWTADGKEVIGLAGVLPITKGLSQELHIYPAESFASGKTEPSRKFAIGQAPLGIAAAFQPEDAALYAVLGDDHLHRFEIPAAG